MERTLFLSLLYSTLPGGLVGVEELADGHLGCLVVASGDVVDNAIAKVSAVAVKEGIGMAASTRCGDAFNVAHLEFNL